MTQSRLIRFPYGAHVQLEYGPYATGGDSHGKDWTDKRFDTLATTMSSPCPYCESILETRVNRPRTRASGRSATVMECPNCGWWILDRCDWKIVEQFESWDIFEGVVSRFELDQLNVPLECLKEYLAKHVSDLRRIHPRKFEELCREVVSDHFKCEVILTGYSKDEGIDLYALRSDLGTWGIQVKRRGSGAEGVVAVREFLGAMIAKGVNSGLFITTADHFTRDACAAVSLPLKNLGVRLDLINYSAFCDMFALHTEGTRPPWEAHLGTESCY